MIVTIRCIGTGAYLSADAFSVKGKDVALIAHVEDLEPKANVVTGLKKQIATKKKP